MMMKKLITIILCILLCALVCACSDKNKGNTNESDTINATDTDAPSIKVVEEIYGMFSEQYMAMYEDIIILPGTFTESSPIYSMIETHNASYDRNNYESLSERAPAVFYIAEKLGLGEEDIRTYYSACVDSKVYKEMPSDAAIAAIASGDAARAMKECVHPSAFSKDGRTYTLAALLSGAASGVSNEEIKTTVEKAKEYYGEKLFDSEKLNEAMREKLLALGFAEAKPSVGNLCETHLDAYHTIPSALEALCDETEYKTWKEKQKGEGGDAVGVNIYSFVRDFSITREIFEEIYNAEGGALGLYNLNVIYNGTAEEAAKYYSESRKTLAADIEADRAMAALKEKAAEDLGMTDFVTNVNEFSLAEILLMTTKDDEYLETLSDYAKSIKAPFEIDFAALYSNSDTLMNMVMGRSPYFIDRYVSGRSTADTPVSAHSVLW